MTLIRLPRLSEAMTEGKLLRWCVRAGDLVRPGDVIAEVEMDKANLEIEATEGGWIAELFCAPGETLPVGAPLARLTDSLDEAAQIETQGPEEVVDTITLEDIASEQTEEDRRGKIECAERQPQELNVSPLAKLRAEELGVDIRTVRGSGPNGRVMEEDVLASYQQMHGTAINPAKVTSQEIGAPSSSSIKLDEVAPTVTSVCLNDQVQAPMCHIPPYAAQGMCMRITFDAQPLLADLGALVTCLSVAASLTPEELLRPLIARAAISTLDEVPALRSAIKHPEAIAGAVAFGLSLGDRHVTPVLRAVNVFPVTQLIAIYLELRERALSGALTSADCWGGEILLEDLREWDVEAPTVMLSPHSIPILCVGTVRRSKNRHFSLSLTLADAGLPPSVVADYLHRMRMKLEHPLLLAEPTQMGSR